MFKKKKKRRMTSAFCRKQIHLKWGFLLLIIHHHENTAMGTVGMSAAQHHAFLLK